MKVINTLTATDTIRLLTPSEYEAGKNVFRKCLATQPNESILIVTDPKKLEDEAAIFFETAKRISKYVYLIIFDGMTQNAQEPPQEITDAMNATNIALLITTYSLSHTNARKNACARGARIISLPGITNELILRTLRGDYQTIAKTSQKVAQRLTTGKTARITSVSGTSITLSIEGRTAIADTGIFHAKGSFGNLPAGEAFLAPVEGTAKGTLVFDGAVAGLDIDSPVSVTLDQGRATSVTGGNTAGLLLKQMQKAGKNAFVLCELGIGTNPGTRLSSNVLEAEKVYGTVHIAFGNNATFGGTNSVAFHSDGVMKYPTVIIDGNAITKEGRIVV